MVAVGVFRRNCTGTVESGTQEIKRVAERNLKGR